MLVMRRRQGEAIMIGDGVEIRILSIDGARVKMGILAPRSVPVTAREIELVRTENRQAAEVPPDAPEAVGCWRAGGDAGLPAHSRTRS